MFETLQQIHSRPKPFEYYTAKELWTDDHTSRQMLQYHLDGSVDISSRKSSFIDASVDWIIPYFRLSGNSRVIDFGCGPGLYTSRLAQKGIRVTGIDFSENSIRYAKEQALKNELDITCINENYLEYQAPGTYDLVIMIMCDFCALSPSQRRVLLDRFYGILKPGGQVLLDVYSLEAFGKKNEGSSFGKNLLHGFWSAHDYFGFLNTFTYDKERVSLDKYTIIEKSRAFTVFNWLQYFDKDSIMNECAKAGFEITEYFSDVAGNPLQPLTDEFAIVAVKK